jgi:NADP-dependent 3-hydroxy acid dehydrogenase YdfG
MSQAERSNQRFIMVTGASSGIGRATTARLADAGHMVFAAARRASALQVLAAEHPRARPVVLDVTDQTSIDSAAGPGRRSDRGPRARRARERRRNPDPRAGGGGAR